MQKILQLLRVRRSINFQQYKTGSVQRRLMRRMAMRKTDHIQEYLEILQRDSAELDALYDDLLINVTEFFRDANVFETLKRLGLPRMVRDRKSGDPIRVWVPGCSTARRSIRWQFCSRSSSRKTCWKSLYNCSGPTSASE